MSKFSVTSRMNLETCDERIQRVFNKVIIYFDCSILEGHRGKEKQNWYYSLGKSKLKWPKGEHNKLPSRAVDAVPYPVDWNDIPRICYFAGYVMATALSMDVVLRWGKDWDGDTDLNDQTFNDSPHFELIG
jgi:hypothetical protein